MTHTRFDSPRVARNVLLLCLGVVTGLTACADDDDGGVSPALRDDVQALLDEAVASGVTPGVVVQVSADGETWSAAAGVADLGRNDAMAPDDRFRGGSILKSFVATAVLQASEAGQLQLDDVLTEHLPPEVTDRIENAERIQLGMLLGHRSGIPEWVGDEVHQTVVLDPAHVWSLDEILDLVAREPAAFEPGERFAYSNTNYILLGEILSRVSGRSWRAVVRDRVLARAGLDHTTLPEPGDLECPAPCAHGYVPFEGEMLDLTRVDPSMAGPSGGHALITTSADLTRFLGALRGGALFDRPSTLEAMFDFQPAPDPEVRLTGYGLGVMQLQGNGYTALGHLGGTAGYQSFMLYLPETGRYVSGFINVMGDVGAVLEPLLVRLATP